MESKSEQFLDESYKGITNFGCFAMRHAYDKGYRTGSLKPQNNMEQYYAVQILASAYESYKKGEDIETATGLVVELLKEYKKESITAVLEYEDGHKEKVEFLTD